VQRLAFSAFALSISLIGTQLRATTEALSAKSDTSLQFLADFFLPSGSVKPIAVDDCRTAYRTKQSNTAGYADIERDAPGIHDRMASAADEACEKAVTRIISEKQQNIKSDWRSSISSPAVQRFVTLFQPEMTLANSKDFVRANQSLPAERKKKFEEKQRELAATPGGAQLLQRIVEYQAKMKRENERPEVWAPVMEEALRAAYTAANLYAKEKGFAAEPYPGM
jgi:hypothetical protein